MFSCLFRPAQSFALAAVAIPLLAGCVSTSATVVQSSGPSISAAQAEPAHGKKPRIAVQPVDAKGQAPNIGAGMGEMLTNALFNSNKFVVLERDRIRDVMAEQDYGDSDRFKRDTVAQKGQLEGAELLIKASITAFEPRCSGGSILIASANEACIGINLRIIDVASGRVVNATTVEATSATQSVGLIFGGGDLPVGLGAYSRTPMEKAIRNAIDQAVQHIANTKM